MPPPVRPAPAGRDYASVAYDIKGSQELSEFDAVTDTAKLKTLQDALGVKATDDKHIEFTLNAAGRLLPLYPDDLGRLAHPPGHGR